MTPNSTSEILLPWMSHLSTVPSLNTATEALPRKDINLSADSGSFSGGFSKSLGGF